MRQKFSIVLMLAIFFVDLCCGAVLAAARDGAGVKNAISKKSALTVENQQLRLRFLPRSTSQMAAFFEARGFPSVMRERLSEYCFFTVIIKNKMNAALWLDLADWNFMAQQQTVARLPRSVWPPIWKELNIPLASQATFRWTLLPETLKFYAHESEGGNIILQKTTQRFLLKARFATGEDKEPMLVTLHNLQCADATEAKQ